METQHHGPLSNIYVLLSMLGMILGISLWTLTPEWGFLFLLVSVLLFIATFVSAVRSPLPTDHDIELAIHEKYYGRRYPDTELHVGLVKKGHKKYISKHKKQLVKWNLAQKEAEKKAPIKKTSKPKKVMKKAPAKKKRGKVVKKTNPKKVSKSPAKKKIVKKATKKKVAGKKRR